MIDRPEGGWGAITNKVESRKKSIFCNENEIGIFMLKTHRDSCSEKNISIV